MLDVQDGPPTSAAAVLLEASGRGVRLWVDGRQLRFRAPSGALDDALRDGLRSARSALLTRLPS